MKSFLGRAKIFAQHGYVTALADYSVACRDKTSPLASMSDAEAAYLWLRGHAANLDVDPRRVALIGGSAGGGMVLVAADRAPAGEKPAAVVAYNPEPTLMPVASIFKLTPAQAASGSSLQLSLKDMPPTLILHGEADQTIPIQESRDICRKIEAGGGSCKVLGYAGLGHGFFNSHRIDPAIGRSPYDDTTQKVLAFLDGLGSSR